MSFQPGDPGGPGRHSGYTPELGDKICALLAEGKSLRTICKADDMPTKETVFLWLRTFPDFKAQYAVAKEESADTHAEDILDIADDGSNDWMESNDPDDPGYKINGEHVQRSKLRLEARKWICAKLKPKKYGDKLAVGGADDLPPVSVQKIERVLVHANSENTNG